MFLIHFQFNFFFLIKNNKKNGDLELQPVQVSVPAPGKVKAIAFDGNKNGVLITIFSDPPGVNRTLPIHF